MRVFLAFAFAMFVGVCIAPHGQAARSSAIYNLATQVETEISRELLSLTSGKSEIRVRAYLDYDRSSDHNIEIRKLQVNVISPNETVSKSDAEIAGMYLEKTGFHSNPVPGIVSQIVIPMGSSPKVQGLVVYASSSAIFGLLWLLRRRALLVRLRRPLPQVSIQRQHPRRLNYGTCHYRALDLKSNAELEEAFATMPFRSALATLRNLDWEQRTAIMGRLKLSPMLKEQITSNN